MRAQERYLRWASRAAFYDSAVPHSQEVYTNFPVGARLQRFSEHDLAVEGYSCSSREIPQLPAQWSCTLLAGLTQLRYLALRIGDGRFVQSEGISGEISSEGSLGEFRSQLKKDDSMQIDARSNFLTALLSVLPDDPGIAVIHSSLPDLMPPPDFLPSVAMDSLSAIVQRGWTLALPAFTFSFCRKGAFSAINSPSETGVLADTVLKHLRQAGRTPHPIYSFAVIGPRADEIVACPSSTTFGDDSPFGLYERENATVIMMGCTWASNTQIHRYEELATVPYRYPKVFSGVADYGGGPHPVQATMWVRDLAANPINDFSLAERNLRAAGLIKSAPLWRECIEAAAAGDIARICRADLAANPYAYVANATEVAKVLARHAEAVPKPSLHIADGLRS